MTNNYINMNNNILRGKKYRRRRRNWRSKGNGRSCKTVAPFRNKKKKERKKKT